MNGNTGWLYNKKYYGILQAVATNGRKLYEFNDELIALPYDEFCQKQLIDEREKKQSINSSYCGFRLQTCYPGLITGIGMNHQTTIGWTREREDEQGRMKKVIVPEFKLGVYFDHTTGMPAIPGSSVKGMLRSFFPISNQKGFCDNYDSKCSYIAGIIERIIEVENYIRDKELIVKLLLQENLVAYYEQNVTQADIFEVPSFEVLKAEKEDELLIWWESGKISDEEFNELSQDLDQLLLNQIKEKNVEHIDKYFEKNGERKRKKKKLWDNTMREYEGNLKDLLSNPLSNDTSDEWIQKAPLIALEMFEGKEEDGNQLSPYSRDIFFDAIPVAGDSEGKLFEKDYITPHKQPLKDPLPICFMKIRSKVKFHFFFRLQDGILSKERKLALIKYLLCNNGIGAKTNVGYGQLQDVSF